MLLPDVNVLLAGFRADHVHHRPARAFLDDARSGPIALGIGDVALSSLVRLATNPRVFVRADTVGDVLDYVDALVQPPTQIVRAGAGIGRASRSSVATCTCAATSSRTRTSPRSRSSRAPSS